MSLDVLIPHYCDLDGLAASLASIGDQTWTGDIRLVVVDDGSPAESFDAAVSLLEAQPLPHIIERNAENRGRPYTRNRLLDLIDSEYVAWLDAGDIWYPQKIARQFEHINRLRFAGERLDNTWITCNYDWQRDGGRRYVVEQYVAGDQLRELFLGERLRAYLWTLLGTADAFRAIGEFDEKLPRLQDLDFFVRFVRAGGKIRNIPQKRPFCLYDKSDLGRSAREIRRCNRTIFEKHRTSFEKYGRDFVATAHYNAERLSARYAKNNGERIGRFFYLSRAVVAHPKQAAYLAGRRIADMVR